MLNEKYGAGLVEDGLAGPKTSEADNLMSVMVDLLSDDELDEFSGTDAALGRAFKEYAGEFEEDEDYEDYEE